MQSLDRIVLESISDNTPIYNPNRHSDDQLEVLAYSYKNTHYRIKYNDILYIETHGLKRYLLIHTLNEAYRCPMTLKELLVKLPNAFRRSHKSFIVNTSLINRVEIDPPQNKAHFVGNKYCFISKSYLSEILDTI